MPRPAGDEPGARRFRIVRHGHTANRGRDAVWTQDAILHFGNEVPRFYTMRLPNRGMAINHITRHRQVTQVLGSAGGTPWLIAVAPPPAQDIADAAPALEDIRAFQIPGDTAIMLLRGTWHAGPLFETPHASFFNLELSDTNVTDHWNCSLAQRYGVTLRLVAG